MTNATVKGNYASIAYMEHTYKYRRLAQYSELCTILCFIYETDRQPTHDAAQNETFHFRSINSFGPGATFKCHSEGTNTGRVAGGDGKRCKSNRQTDTTGPKATCNTFVRQLQVAVNFHQLLAYTIYTAQTRKTSLQKLPEYAQREEGVLSGGRAIPAGSDPAGKPGPMDALNLKLFYPTYFRRHDYCLPCPACNCFVVSILFSSTFVELFAIYTHKQQQQQQQPELAVGRSLCQQRRANDCQLPEAGTINKQKRQMNPWGEPEALGSLGTELYCTVRYFPHTEPKFKFANKFQ